jgi:hypothetical protein
VQVSPGGENRPAEDLLIFVENLSDGSSGALHHKVFKAEWIHLFSDLGPETDFTYKSVFCGIVYV